MLIALFILFLGASLSERNDRRESVVSDGMVVLQSWLSSFSRIHRFLSLVPKDQAPLGEVEDYLARLAAVIVACDSAQLSGPPFPD
jgi:hypothetical protein